jgi:hypothetical protein
MSRNVIYRNLVLSINFKRINYMFALCVCGVLLLPQGINAAEPAEGYDPVSIVVHKTPTCGCCGKWVDHLRQHGFSVEVKTVASTRSVQELLGVPPQIGSCHTAQVGDYWVEGHVPADVIRKLLDEKPVGILGISAPGMPMGSPGMEGPNAGSYDIIALNQAGELSRYATLKGKAKP